MSRAEIIYVAIVDDDESICRSLGRLLQAADFHPIAYASAEEFLTDWKRPRFDCLLLDLQMDGMSGLELKEQLDKAGSVPPVIYITAHEDAEARLKALALGCEGYFRKTAPGGEIIEAIRAAVARFHTSPASVNPKNPSSALDPPLSGGTS